ncbi:hypothetical protein APHAL10511_007489 [Amanita phalloides]|nr:hypothetical protein APHAL10511_007489 [Amanita phalloides]
MNAWILRGKYPDALKELSPADKLFLDHYFSLRRPQNLRKVVELWDGLRKGVLTVDEAVASVPVEKVVRRLPSRAT